MLGIVMDDSNDDYSDEALQNEIQEALGELEVRKADSSDHYPFDTDRNTIFMKDQVSENTLEVYKFLLLATRENMQQNKVADGIDATAVFEQLCSEVIRNYFGHHSQSFVFGTGAEQRLGFKQKIEQTLHSLNVRGYRFRQPDGDTGHHQDAGVDIIVFIPFNDHNKGQFVALGQCKTGTSWKGFITPPFAFFDKYIEPSVVFRPIIFYMVCESFFDSWESIGRNSMGLMFDRERIMQYLPTELPLDLIGKIKRWNASTISRNI